jgi:DNA-binding beta-propeller fold protein YncE
MTRRLLLVLVVTATAVPSATAEGAQRSPWSGLPESFAHTPRTAATALTRSAPRPTTAVPVPQTVTFSPRFKTVYATSDAGIVAVIDARRCHAHRRSGCDAPVATMEIGPTTTGDVAIEETSGTGYITSIELGTVSVFDATRCNARVTSGCDDPRTEIETGGLPVGTGTNAKTRTLYVGNAEGYVSVVDMAMCNRSTTAGCSEPPAQIALLPEAVWPVVDETTNTIYVPETGPEGGEFGTTLAVVDGSDCNGQDGSGCGDAPARVTVGEVPATATVDPHTRTVYVSNAASFDVSVVDARRCNGQDSSGCAQTPATIRVGAEPNSGLVVDRSTKTLFVSNTQSDTVSAVDVRHCHAADTSGCSERPPNFQTGLQPFWIELDRATGTLYIPQHVDEDVAAFDAGACNARRRAGCRREAPAVAIPDGVWSVEVDARTNTLYAGGGDEGRLSLVDTRRCRAGRTSGCDQVPFDVPVGTVLRQLLLDRGTRTLYALDIEQAELLVLDASTCNGRRHTGCAPIAAVPTGAFPIALARNPRTGAIYTANIGGGDVTIIDGTRCNATDTSGCSTPPQSVPLEGGPFGVATDPRTNTAYVSLIDGSAVAVLHGSTPVGTIPDIPLPAGLDVDRRARTLYVANFQDTDAPGALSIVDIRDCNGEDAGSCAGPWPTTPTGRGPWAVLVDPLTHRVYTSDFAHATVTAIGRKSRHIPVGNIPLDLVLDRTTGTLYVADAPDRQVSVIDARR